VSWAGDSAEKQGRIPDMTRTVIGAAIETRLFHRSGLSRRTDTDSMLGYRPETQSMAVLQQADASKELPSDAPIARKYTANLEGANP
jgi:hypothetical protein